MERKISANDVAIARRRHKRNIGKLQVSLSEKITAAIEQGINESFSSWKDDNLPKFNSQEFAGYAAQLFKVINQLVAEKEILQWKSFAILNGKQVCILTAGEVEKSPEQLVRDLLTNAKAALSDKFADAMNKCFFVFLVDGDKNLAKYLKSSADPVQQGKIYVDADRNICLTTKDASSANMNAMKLYITGEDIIKNPLQIVEFLS